MTVSFTDWITELANWVFLLIALPTVAAAFFVVTAKNVVRAVLALVVTLAGTAALFLMLGAEFVGWTVVLVYIGAVIILFLMGIMITRSPLTRSVNLSQPMSTRTPAVLLSVILFGVIAWAMIVSFGAEAIPLPDEATRTASIGEALFTNWVIPFEVVSFVLLAALIGGITLARRDPSEGGDA
jgi:NADH-quinone oxidoreductase subunit J